MKKLSVIILILLVFTFPSAAQNGDDQKNTKPQESVSVPAEAAEPDAESVSKTSSKFDIFVKFGPNLLINTESTTESAPSPIMYSFGVGIQWPDTTFVSFQPAISFFTNYYLWDGNNALPAEVENRTALVLSLMIDLPAVLSFRYGKSTFQAGTGTGILVRYGIIPAGVSGSDQGTAGSVSDDIDKINAWFWSDLRYIYPELTGSWTFRINEKISTGFETRFYLSLGSLLKGRGLDASLFSLAAKLVF